MVYLHDGEREELSSGEDQLCGGGDPAAGVGTDDRVCAVKMTGRNREQRSGAHLFSGAENEREMEA